MSGNANWWDEVEAVIAEKSLLKHPFYQAWTMGRLTREDLAYYAQQYYQQESRFPRYVSAVHSNCPELRARQMLLENLSHEEAGSENHPELWLRFAEAVGASREAVVKAEMSGATQACVRTFESLAHDPSWPVGLAALYAYEAQQPAVARTKREGLVGRYGVCSEPALAFFRAHEELDQWHSEAERRMLLEQAGREPSLKGKVVAAVSRACDALNGLLDGVCEARGIECPAAA